MTFNNGLLGQAHHGVHIALLERHPSCSRGFDSKGSNSNTLTSFRVTVRIDICRSAPSSRSPKGAILVVNS